MLVKAVLISPKMLYRSELGPRFETAPRDGEIVVLDEFEIANLLSYGLTDAAPDDALLAAADAGRLRDGEERRLQARRLMARSRGVWQRFFWEWLHMHRFEPTASSLAIAPSLQASMRDEFEEFIGHIVVDDRGSLYDVFTSTRSWASPELAEFYGVAHPGTGVQPIAFDAAERAGLLTQGAWLVSHGSREDEHVVRRGMGIYLERTCRASER